MPRKWSRATICRRAARSIGSTLAVVLMVVLPLPVPSNASEQDQRPCDGVLQGGLDPNSVENAIAGAWAETLNLFLSDSKLSIEEISRSLIGLGSAGSPSSAWFGIANKLPMPSELADALESLAALSGNFIEQGVASEKALEAALGRQLNAILSQLGVEGRIVTTAEETRSEVRSAVTVVPLHGRVMAPASRFSDGTLVSADLGGHVVRFNESGRVLFDVKLGQPFSRGPVELASGRTLVLNSTGRTWVLDSQGRVESQYEISPGSGINPPLLLRDGGVLLSGADGQLLFLNADGTVRGRRNLSFWLGGTAAQQEDGTILVLSSITATLYRLSPDARLIDSIRLLDGLTFQGVVTPLPNGGGIVNDHRGRLHFLDASWNPMKRWYFSEVTLKPEGGAMGEITRYPDGLFGVRGWKEGFVVFDEQGRKRWSLTDLSISSPFPIQVSPGVFFLKSESRGWILGGPAQNGLRTCEVDAGAKVSAPPVLLADGTIALGHADGLVQILNPDGTGAFSHRLSGPIAEKIGLLPGGKYLAPVDGFGNVILDPSLAAEDDGDSR